MKIILFDVEQNEVETYQKLLASTEQIECLAEPLNEESVSKASEAEIVSVFVTSKITADMIKKLPHLKLIVCRSTGYDNVDTLAAKNNNIVVENAPNYGEHTVAEYAFMLLLALTRKLQGATAQVNSGQIDHTQLVGTDLLGSTLGVIGAGKIGQRVIKIAKGFEMNVVAYDPYPNAEAAKELGFEYVQLDELYAQADVISLHIPATPESKNMINAEVFKKLKKDTYLINTSRGDLVDNAALIDALENGNVAGAGLDVLEGEAMIDIDHELALLKHPNNLELKLSAELDILEKMPNVILSPHNAYNTHQALQRIRETTSENINGFINGEIKNQVN